MAGCGAGRGGNCRCGRRRCYRRWRRGGGRGAHGAGRSQRHRRRRPCCRLDCQQCAVSVPGRFRRGGAVALRAPLLAWAMSPAAAHRRSAREPPPAHAPSGNAQPPPPLGWRQVGFRWCRGRCCRTWPGCHRPSLGQRQRSADPRVGLAAASPPADRPCRDDHRPHAARGRWRRLGQRPEPGRFGFLRRTSHAIQANVGALRRYAAACHAVPIRRAVVGTERIGSARVQAKNWRLMAFGCLTLALLMCGVAWSWRSAQSIVTAFRGGWVTRADRSGPWAKPRRRTGPNDAQIALPPGAVHHAGSLALHRPDRGAAELARRPTTTPPTAARPCSTDYARTNDQFVRVGRESVTVQITSVHARQRFVVQRALDGTAFRQRRTGRHRTLERRGVHRPANPAHGSNACARNRWASTSTACRGAASWIASEGAKP